MRQKKGTNWTYHEWSIPCPIGISEFARLSGVKQKPLTKEEQEIWDRMQKFIAEAKKWPKIQNRKRHR